jgi:hypothetical protein
MQHFQVQKSLYINQKSIKIHIIKDQGDAVAQLFEALYYRPEGRRFNFR